MVRVKNLLIGVENSKNKNKDSIGIKEWWKKDDFFRPNSKTYFFEWTFKNMIVFYWTNVFIEQTILLKKRSQSKNDLIEGKPNEN